MKAAVLARGLGRRMREHDPAAALSGEQAVAAAAGAKAMMPIAGGATPRPFLDYVIGSLVHAGITDVALVIGPEHDEIRERYSNGGAGNQVSISCVEQSEPRGTADAVLACQAWAGSAPFIVVNADNLYPVSALVALRTLATPGLPVFEREDLIASGNIPASRVAAFALVHVDSAGWLKGIEEKPDAASLSRLEGSALISMNCWRFDWRIFSACRDVPPSARGEFELPQAVGLALARGVPFRAVPARGPVLDLSRQGDVGEVSKRLESLPAPW